MVQLIEFMAKDIPSYKEPLKNGLVWIDSESRKRFDNVFVDCEIAQQKEILDEIAFYDPNKSIEEYPEPVQWFNLVRNLTMTGYFTSEVGIKELGYKGNTPMFGTVFHRTFLINMVLSMIKIGWINLLINQKETI